MLKLRKMSKGINDINELNVSPFGWEPTDAAQVTNPKPK